MYLRIVFIFIVICFFNQKILPETIQKGFLNIKNQSMIDLKGEWEFYWQKFYTLQEIHQIQFKTYCYVPHNWIPCNQEHSGTGFATYYLKIQIPDRWLNQEIGLYIPTIGTSYKIYINGELKEEVGKVSNIKSKQIPLYGNRIILWKAEKTEQEILIHVSNFYHKSGGLWYNISFGLKKEIEHLFFKNLFFDLALFGSVFIMALFHFGIFIQKFLLRNTNQYRRKYKFRTKHFIFFYFLLFDFYKNFICK
ncbi:MAG: hypothetical protein KatS3mg129_0004 [Leptospiraceae bacterium]|nr:MAG: hypothetical protein KatS3mg129_0004 [Leptospiraceae bacterium]